MQHERVADNVFVFQSELYAQVNAGVVAAPDMAIVIDTLALPEETRQMRDFIVRELRVPVRFVINTHYHADHSWGNAFFPEAKVIAHARTYQQLKEKGIPALAAEKEHNSQFNRLHLVLPHITFDSGELVLQIGQKTLTLFALPGHSADNIGVLIEDDRVLFAGDTYMPLPLLVDGDIDDMQSSLKKITKMSLENLVPGHGDIVLRGEVDVEVKSNLDYLSEIRKAVRKAHRRKFPLDLLEEVDVEECGKGRVLIGGLAAELHQRNLVALYRHYYGEDPVGSEVYFEER